MSQARTSVAIPEPMQTLRPEDMKGDGCPIPREPGVYAAWITTDEALEQLGVEGPAPVVAYIGKAGPTSRTKGKPRTLLDRLREHVRQPGQQDCYPFFELAELLGVRRTILPPIWHRSFYKVQASKYRSRPSPLGQLSINQALAWQYEHLVWGWSALPASQVNQVESALIKEHLPLLNHRGMPAASPPPQLRRIGSYEADRARWLALYSYVAAASRVFEEADASGSFEVDSTSWPVVAEDQTPVDAIGVFGLGSVRNLHWGAGSAAFADWSWGDDLADAWAATFLLSSAGESHDDRDRSVRMEEALWIAAAIADGGIESLLATTPDESDIVWTMPAPSVVSELLALQKKWTSWERH